MKKNPVSLMMIAATYTGNPDDSVPGYPSEDPESWTYVGNVPDVTQDFKDYVDPLTSEQMLELMKDYSEYESTGQSTCDDRHLTCQTVSD